MSALAFLNHHQLHEVLFAFLPTRNILGLRCAHSMSADLVIHYAKTQLQDVMGQSPDSLPSSPTHRTMDAAFVQLLVRCGEGIAEVLKSAPCSVRCLSRSLFRGDSTYVRRVLCTALESFGSPDLQVLDVGGTGVTDNVVGALALNCHQLQLLDVFYTDGKITDESIKAVAMNCPQLQSLNVFFTSGKITDESIKAVAMNCPQLQSLDVSGTDGKITDESIKAVAMNCAQLQSLDVSYTKGKISDDSLRQLATSCKVTW